MSSAPKLDEKAAGASAAASRSSARADSTRWVMGSDLGPAIVRQLRRDRSLVTVRERREGPQGLLRVAIGAQRKAVESDPAHEEQLVLQNVVKGSQFAAPSMARPQQARGRETPAVAGIRKAHADHRDRIEQRDRLGPC